MNDVLYLAWCYLAHQRVKTIVLVFSIALIFFIPAGLRVLIEQSRSELTARAEATPLLVGKKGSPTELVLNSLYFSTDVPERMRYHEVKRVRATGYAEAIPLYARFRARDLPIVGTTIDYFAFRGLRVARGRQMTRLGDCVVGARTGIEPGGSVVSSPESLFDLAGVYPLKMRVTGVLAPSGGPDDDAVFVDVKTAWVIEGLAHGHGDLKEADILKRESGRVVANPAVQKFYEITDDNLDSFHFHGNPDEFPITSVLAVPHEARSATLLRGRYEAPDETHQILRPVDVLEELMGTVLTIESFVLAALVIVGAATLLTAALVFVLSLRLRRREIETMQKIGGSRGRILSVLVCEIAGIVVAGLVLAALLTWMTAALGADAVRSWIA
ncbi:MAG: ABC transporter permease [Planctomycetota bacterium]|nr:ABC transporter permease [Planctomycetota bacterium]